MTKKIKYIGTQDRWPELPYTGKQSIWHVGQQEERSDSEADALLSTAKFSLISSSNPGFPGGGKYKKLLFIGDSFVDYCTTKGRPLTGFTNVTGVISKGASLNWPDGAAVMTYNKNDGTISIQAFGDSVGPAVDVSKGTVATLTSGNPLYTLRIGVKQAYLPSANASDSLTPGVAGWSRNTGSWIHAIQALTRNRFSVLPDLGISGDQAVNMSVAGGRYDQAIALASSGDVIIVEMIGQNDLQLSPQQSASTIASTRSAFWAKCANAGIPVIACLLSPRWGRDADGTNGADVAKYSSTLQATLVAANRLCTVSARGLSSAYTADTYSAATDATNSNGRLKDGWSVNGDGLHPGGSLAVYGFAKPIVRILNIISPADDVVINVGAGSYYDAVNNPSGNLLQSNTGAFAGTGGTAGSGVTVGTGLAASMSCSHQGTAGSMVAVANKVAADDHGADWQELAISGCTSTGEQIGMFFPQVTNSKFTAGIDTISGGVEFRIVGTGCGGVYFNFTQTGAPGNFSVQANQLKDVVAGLDNESGIIHFEAYPIPTGVTDISPRLYVQSLVGATFKIQYRNAEIHKVL